MAGPAKYLMIASMDVDPEHEATFNEVYDTEHSRARKPIALAEIARVRT